MNFYPININSKATLKNLQEGLFIFIFRATRIPPHLGIIYNGKLYDISLNGPNIDLPVSDFYNTIHKRKTETIFIELVLPNANIDVNTIVIKQVKKHYKVTPQTSCLAPIKGFITDAYNLDVSNSNFIFELLPILLKNKLIKASYETNLSHRMIDNVYRLNKYDKTDIENCINALQRKEKITC